MFSTGDELLKFIKDEGVEFVDVRFVDLPGIQQLLVAGRHRATLEVVDRTGVGEDVLDTTSKSFRVSWTSERTSRSSWPAVHSRRH